MAAGELSLEPCGSCGAALPVELDRLEAHCEFCGSDTRFRPDQLRRHRALPIDAAQAETEGLEALREALRREIQPGPLGCLGAVGMGMMSLMIVASVQSVFHALPGFMVPLSMGVLGVVLATPVLVHWLYRRSKAPARARAEVERIRASVVRSPQKGQCPACGGPMQIPAMVVAMDCPFCHAPLFASDGMLVRWVNDASQRRLGWQTQAEALLKRVERRSNRQLNFGCVAVYLVPFAFAIVFLLILFQIKDRFGEPASGSRDSPGVGTGAPVSPGSTGRASRRRHR